MAFAWIDVVILALIALSAILSLFRGFVREAVALATWLVALMVSMAFYEDLATILSQWISTPSAQKITAFAVLFVCVLLLGAIVNYLAGKLVDKTGLTGTDKMLGIVFGVARGGDTTAAGSVVAGLAIPRLF
jgi:membrane protein required for colicin V production